MERQRLRTSCIPIAIAQTDSTNTSAFRLAVWLASVADSNPLLFYDETNVAEVRTERMKLKFLRFLSGMHCSTPILMTLVALPFSPLPRSSFHASFHEITLWRSDSTIHPVPTSELAEERIHVMDASHLDMRWLRLIGSVQSAPFSRLRSVGSVQSAPSG
jgi:hypothetical protein